MKLKEISDEVYDKLVLFARLILPAAAASFGLIATLVHGYNWEFVKATESFCAGAATFLISASTALNIFLNEIKKIWNEKNAN